MKNVIFGEKHVLEENQLFDTKMNEMEIFQE